MIKFVAIVSLIVVGLVMVAMHFQSRPVWKHHLHICGMTVAGS
ncbi:hypothetical protein ACNKHM_08965 [Shigella sonnei]